ncbi:MAG: hypothetical protein IJ346_03555 [Clostridia bacterium]|nr:hypothetical protein [Clostridia bacterium]
MNKGKITIKFLLVAIMAVMVLGSVSAFSAFAEPDETYAVESYVATDDEEETTAESATATVATEPEPTYRAPLPTIEDTEIVPPTVVGHVEEKEEPSLFWGFISWILIGVGVAVVFAVVLSTKAKTYRGGRDRYSNTDKISGKKKLLPQDYYDKRKRR